jgi:hypothetical protein
VIQLFLSTENRGRRKKKVTVAGLVLVITLTGSGCAAVEPEKRAYPLALGAGVSENGFVLKYAMPDMSTATGQEKPDEDPISVLTLSIFCKKSAPLHGSTERIHMKAFQKFNVILIFLIKIVSYIASHFIVEIRN